jgi:hypothetical protein
VADDGQKKIEQEKLVPELDREALELLTDRQLRVCEQIQFDRVNKRARTRVEAVLKDQVKAMAEALTQAPYVYLGPEIKIMAGCSVRYATLMKAQLDDAHKELDQFMNRENPNDLRTTDHLNKLLVVHSLFQFNGTDFGGVRFDADEYQRLSTSAPDDAQKMLATMRNERLRAIGNLSPHVYQRLVEYYQAFQMTVEALSKSEDMDEVLGN